MLFIHSTITNNTQFDQAFIPGRNIFLNIQDITYRIFNQFIRRPGRTEPYFSSYCDGDPTTTWSRCAGMSQHGSQILAGNGYTPIQILRYYYPQDINIVQSTNFGPRNPGAYPGTPLREGSTGEDVRRLQLYLNRISGNWWIPAIQNPNGVFGPDTTASVKAFQSLRSLTPDGVVGQLTWNEIVRVYVAARRMAELDSEGQRYGIGNSPPSVVLQQGARGEAVVELQFLLNYIGQFYNELPYVVEDSVFRDTTRTAVIAFQNRFGLMADGVVGAATWNKLYEVFKAIQANLAGTEPPPIGPAIPPFPGSNLQVGSQSANVTTMQRMLNGVARCNPSITTLTTDGVFGAITQSAVQEFQRIFGLPQTGVINHDTWEAYV
ncbi:MAG: peptidoglycan-binding protein [Defluviitaleaceae bacterium]|nr:peptidoglycan-binding protein [Defluviitaleaceae bacterium]